MKQNITIILLLVLIVLFGISLEAKPLGGNNTFSSVTNSTSSVGMTSTKLLDASAVRRYAKICNQTGSQVWLSLSDSASLNAGIPIYASSTSNHCYQIDSDNLYVGSVYGIADTTSTVSISYK